MRRARLLGMATLFTACPGREPEQPDVAEMLRIPGGTVRLGKRLSAPVPGFEPPKRPPEPPHASSPTAPLPPGPGGAPGIHPAPDPLDPRDVLVSPFDIDRTEVTRAQYARFIDASGYRPPFVDEEWASDGWNWKEGQYPGGTGDHPVVLVSWYDAQEYCAWVDKRLPTEAEWQLAALGPAEAERLFPWGERYDGRLLNHGTLEPPNYDDSDGWERTSPVASFPKGASAWGLQDTFGNVWEWTRDFRVSSWETVLGERTGEGASERILDPSTSSLGLYAAVRGGSYFFDFRPNPAGERNAFLAELRRKSTGFRCARSVR